MGADRVCWRCGTPVDQARPGAVVLPHHRLRRRAAGLRRHRLARADQGSCRPTGSAAPRAPRSTSTLRVEHAGGRSIRVFTTRPDTLFGATFMVLAPEHPLVDELTAPDQQAEVEATRFEARRKSEIDRLSTDREKTGVPIGSYAINPVNGERIPIWIADYVLPGYGTGAIMAVPAHDERDFAFAQKFGLPIRQVDRRAPTDARRTSRLAGVRRTHAGRGAGQLRRLLRHGRARGRSRDRRRPGAARAQGDVAGHVPAARLAGQPPARLGHADPGRLLRGRPVVRHRSRAR